MENKMDASKNVSRKCKDCGKSLPVEKLILSGITLETNKETGENLIFICNKCNEIQSKEH